MEKELDKKDLEKIKDIQDIYNQLIFNIGEFNFEKMQIMKDLDMKESFLKESEEEFQKNNDELHQYLLEKYGKGKIDLTKGTITID